MNAPAAAGPAEPGDLWERVKGLKPRLRPNAHASRHVYRGEPWTIIRDRASTRHFRLDAGTWALVAGLDGSHTLEQLHEGLQARLGADAPDRNEIAGLIGRLREADLLRFDRPSDAAELYGRWAKQSRRQRWSVLLRPLSMRFSLLDPEAFLEAAAPVARPLFGAAGLALWLLAVIAGLVLAAVHAPELSEHAARRMLDPENLLLVALAYPVVKALHELGHGLAVKVQGGEVHEMGIMLIVLFPVPYVDASAASSFPRKGQRMLVGAAGVLVETFLAALGVAVWTVAEPGLVRDLAFDVALIGGVSTLLFNGNPLLRFDGYYVLADAIEIPNLGPRATRYYGYLARRYLLRLTDAVSPVTAPGEREWFIGFGGASFAYRLFVVFAIALYVAETLPVFGLVLAVWALVAQVVVPVGRQLAFLLFDPVMAGRRGRGIALFCGVAGALAIGFGFVPAPSRTVAEGFVRLPEQSLVRAGGAGFIRGPLRDEGERVAIGEPIFELDDPELDTRVTVLEAKLGELRAGRARSLLSDRVRAGILEEEIDATEIELEKLKARSAEQIVRSPLAGALVVPRARDLAGRFAHQGDVLAYVIDRPAEVARVVVPQARADLIRRRTVRVEARLATRHDVTLEGRILREVPSASGRLPSRSLGTRGGGSIAVDATDAEGLRAIEPVFEFDISLPNIEAASFVGSRVFVKFVHEDEPLARQWGRDLRQLFLSRLQL